MRLLSAATAFPANTYSQQAITEALELQWSDRLDAAESALELPPDALAVSWASLRNVGNLSSASVLAVLEEYLDTRRGVPGSYSLLAAMGPGFCAELVLLQW